MSKPEFGDLAQQNPRDFWPHEAADFTPWLARPENIARLSQAVGLELEVESVEEPVGPFNADIVCTSLGDHRRVVIECKFTEPGFGTCSRPRLRPTDKSYSEQRCDGSYRIQAGRSVRCALTGIGVQYWDHLPKLFA